MKNRRGLGPNPSSGSWKSNDHIHICYKRPPTKLARFLRTDPWGRGGVPFKRVAESALGLYINLPMKAGKFCDQKAFQPTFLSSLFLRAMVLTPT